MMIKYRVHEVAKDFDMPNNKEIISLLEKYTGETKKHMTALAAKAAIFRIFCTPWKLRRSWPP